MPCRRARLISVWIFRGSVASSLSRLPATRAIGTRCVSSLTNIAAVDAVISEVSTRTKVEGRRIGILAHDNTPYAQTARAVVCLRAPGRRHSTADAVGL